MKKSFKTVALITAILLAAALLPGCGEDVEIEVPGEIQALADKVLGIAKKYGNEMDGGWGDLHAAMMGSELGDEYANFEAMREMLEDFIAESGAKYIYAMYPKDISDSETPFFITVDGSDDPDDFGAEYEIELPFVKAWFGTAESSSYAWEDDDGGYCWSAYAPVRDSNGEVVAIVGVDYDAPIIKDFPDWNIDSDDWNEMEEW